MKGCIIVNEKDNAATILRGFKRGEKVASIELLNDIISGHKFVLEDIKRDEIIIKHAEAIASASCDISTGEWVHIYNTAEVRGRGDKE